MKTLIRINGKYVGYIKPWGAYHWLARRVSGKGKRFHQAADAAAWVRLSVEASGQ